MIKKAEGGLLLSDLSRLEDRVNEDIEVAVHDLDMPIYFLTILVSFRLGSDELRKRTKPSRCQLTKENMAQPLRVTTQDKCRGPRVELIVILRTCESVDVRPVLSDLNEKLKVLLDKSGLVMSPDRLLDPLIPTRLFRNTRYKAWE